MTHETTAEYATRCRRSLRKEETSKFRDWGSWNETSYHASAWQGRKPIHGLEMYTGKGLTIPLTCSSTQLAPLDIDVNGVYQGAYCPGCPSWNSELKRTFRSRLSQCRPAAPGDGDGGPRHNVGGRGMADLDSDVLDFEVAGNRANWRQTVQMAFSLQPRSYEELDTNEAPRREHGLGL